MRSFEVSSFAFQLSHKAMHQNTQIRQLYLNVRIAEHFRILQLTAGMYLNLKATFQEIFCALKIFSYKHYQNLSLRRS